MCDDEGSSEAYNLALDLRRLLAGAYEKVNIMTSKEQGHHNNTEHIPGILFGDGRG